jgi:ABC-2 type transport system permease protein
MHPIHADIADNLAYKVITVIVIIPTVIALVLVFKPAIQPPFWSAVAFLPALIMAYLIQFLLGWALAMIAFWTTRIMAINRMYFLGKLFLAGQLAPLTLLPLTLQTVASISPYRWMLSFPVELLLGYLSPEQAWQGLAAQATWVVLSIAAVKIVWRAGVKRYAAFGA